MLENTKNTLPLNLDHEYDTKSGRRW